MYKRQLRYHVHNLTKKAILQLINVCRNLGSEVIYADRGKLVLKTGKVSVESCYAYSQYLVKAIRTSPLFSFLDLSISRYWDLLIWMDSYNFGGRACTQILETDQQDLQAYSQWHIRSFLPLIYQQEFDDWVIIILDSMIKAKESYYQNVNQSQRLTQLTRGQKAEDDELGGALAGFTNRFKVPIVKRVQKLLQNQKDFILDPNFSSDYKSPNLPGSHLKVRNPLLELVKSCLLYTSRCV